MWENTESESQENYILPLLKEIKEQKKDERKGERNEGRKEGRTD